MSPAYTIMVAAILTEGLLVIISYPVLWLSSREIAWNFSVLAASIGLASALPLLIINHLLWRVSLTKPRSVFARFSSEVIVPLCRQITPSNAFVIALLSGFGEELFFRGALNQLILKYSDLFTAALLSSVLFAYIHFIGNMRRFGWMMPLYSCVGLYLWLVHYYTDSLFAVVITHATYNFLAILWIRRSTRATSSKQKLCAPGE